jgi:hypothetical protein
MRSGRAILLAALAALALAAPFAVPGRAQRFVPTADPGHPKLKFADSLVSLNDRCMVRASRLNARIAAQYVNGQPLGFC